MSKPQRRLTRDYAVALRNYLADEREEILAEAYDLGRRAIGRGVGVLDMARTHHRALQEWQRSGATAESWTPIPKAAETFLLESLSPFEVTHRGFRETNVRLQHLISTLEQHNLDLAEINGKLQLEIRERIRTEIALRESERRLRKSFEEARCMEERLRNLSNQVLHAQEEERKRISRELHDEIGQALMAISVTLAGLKQGNPGSDGRSGGKLAEVQELLRATMESAHHFARELRPAMLDELGLLPTLRSYLKSFARRTGLAVRFRGDNLAEGLHGDQKTVLYRVAQESLTNVTKHARASRVVLSLGKVGNAILMEIADDGRSFREGSGHSPKATMRLGLLGMQERVRLVNGRFAILPRPGRGTTVRVTIPFALRSASRARVDAPAPNGARAETLYFRAKTGARAPDH